MTKEPVVAIMGAGVVLVNAIITLALSFVTDLTTTQTAAIYGVVNPLAVFALAFITRGKVVSLAALNELSDG